MMHQHIISSRFPLKCAEAARGGGAGEGGRCGCRAEADRGEQGFYRLAARWSAPT